ncbi:hypothetical protein BC830DRAFT_432913 [Chytriomyces sp. MP71]|nr:hypothetical protein BC830DRAFT_432913 [Chytriomyces sp. MP71]
MLTNAWSFWRKICSRTMEWGKQRFQLLASNANLARQPFEMGGSWKGDGHHTSKPSTDSLGKSHLSRVVGFHQTVNCCRAGYGRPPLRDRTLRPKPYWLRRLQALACHANAQMSYCSCVHLAQSPRLLLSQRARLLGLGSAEDDCGHDNLQERALPAASTTSKKHIFATVDCEVVNALLTSR